MLVPLLQSLFLLFIVRRFIVVFHLLGSRHTVDISNPVNSFQIFSLTSLRYESQVSNNYNIYAHACASEFPATRFLPAVFIVCKCYPSPYNLHVTKVRIVFQKKSYSCSSLVIFAMSPPSSLSRCS